MTPEVLVERLNICQTCESYFRKTCLLGHTVQSWPGCPRKKFPPFNAHFGYAEPRQIQVHSEPGCCGESVRYLTWTEVTVEFTRQIAEWVRLGMPLADGALHQKRFNACKKCTHYRHYQCLICKCIAWVKTKLGNATCLDNPPQW